MATATDTSTVEVPDGEVVYVRRGDGPALLFLHGAHLPGAWLELHDLLAENADVLVPTHPGFRDGQPPQWLGGFDDLVLLYRDVLDALGIERAVVAGHGIGAWLAADLAIFCPQRVAALALLAPLGLRVPGTPPADYLSCSAERLEELLGGDEFLPDFDDPESFARFYGEMGVVARLVWERRYDLKLERRLPRVDVRAVVIQGEDDALLPRAHAERWAELLPRARLELVPRAGHLVHAQAPGACADAIGRLLG